MSAGHHESGYGGRAASENVLRVLFGVAMAFIAIGVLVYSSLWFAVLLMLIVAAAAREWHRLVRARREQSEDRAILIQTLVTVGVIGAAILALLLGYWPASFLILALGAGASFIAGRNREDNPLWHAVGVFYIGLGALALAALRDIPTPPQGIEFVLGLFLIVWATDTGALVFGKLIGGRKLAPAISPAKTWAGTIGGSLAGAMVYALYIAVLGFNVAVGFAFALFFSAVGHAGDLLESRVKRHFGTKDSGGLIPGHGGVLDRIDSLLVAAPMLALLVFGLHFNPLLGGFP